MAPLRPRVETEPKQRPLSFSSSSFGLQKNDNDNDDVASHAETDRCRRLLTAWDWRPGGGITWEAVLSPPLLERTSQALLVVIAAQSRGFVLAPAALFSRAWRDGWTPSPTKAEISALKARKAEELAKAEEARQYAERRRQVVEGAKLDGLAAEIAAELPPDRRAAVEREAREKAEALARLFVEQFPGAARTLPARIEANYGPQLKRLLLAERERLPFRPGPAGQE